MGEKFAANPVTGTGTLSLPIPTSPGRSGFGPQLSLAYNSGAGNGPFGFGWQLSLASISRKTDLGLPQYFDSQESDTFILSNAEDLVPEFEEDGAGGWVMDGDEHVVFDKPYSVEGADYRVRRYRPRVEGLFARIERWTRADGDVHWRSISRDNTLTIYGNDTTARIADPADGRRVFSWLISETRDDKGNAVVYEYKQDDGVGAKLTQLHERNRGPLNDPRRRVNRYLKRILYGNRAPLLDGAGQRPHFLTPAALNGASWMFEIVFDYDDHDLAHPAPRDDEARNAAGALLHPWAFRQDPFSTYRPGFELRTTRLCQRVLMFHHFPGEPGVGADCLVHSTEFTYSYEQNPNDARNPIYSFLRSASHTGYQRAGGGYRPKSLPPVEFVYTEPVIQAAVEEVDAASRENLPIGLDGAIYQWADLHGEGVPGLLSEQAGAWFYKRNLSPLPIQLDDGRVETKARFAPTEIVANKPNLTIAAGAQLVDLAGDGQPDLVILDGPTPGLYEHDNAEGWQLFHPFAARLNRDSRDPNLRLVDLDGDGRADVLITEDDALVWHPSLGEAGFGPARRSPQPHDEEHGPRLAFADGTESIFLADLSGDGLADLVRIRNGEVCYWPNLGYGRFGAKVGMDNAPHFDNPDQFDPKRLRLADIDGSGTTDIIYLHRDGVRLYFNQSGNGWSAPTRLAAFPSVNDLIHVMPVDLLGNGTACLVWSSPLPGDTRRPLRYVRLMGEHKPHLLVTIKNNLGAETQIGYAPSTKFYLHDKAAGQPWVTRLPFPVHVVEQVETVDYVSRTRFVTRYAYHHGFFDGEEREFRGFGMVEQSDSEAFEDYVVGVQRIEGAQELAPELVQPPVTTRTWFHTGALLDQGRFIHQYHKEYYQQSQHLPEPALPAGMSAAELRECARALKGLALRKEVYSFDGSPAEQHPYTVVENTFEVRCIQPQGRQRNGVFFSVGREGVALNYERNPADPRIAHTFELELDKYGNTRKACSVVYGRKLVDPALPAQVTRDQQRLAISYGETDYTRDIAQGSPTRAYRLRTPCESRSYEISGVAPAGDLFTFGEIAAAIATTTPLDYELLAGAAPQRRMLGHSRTLFRDNALAPLALGEWDSLGLAFESYTLAFTPGVVAAHYAAEVSSAEFAAAGYVHFAGDANWWMPSGTALYPANPAAHYFLAVGSRDPLGVETVATLDAYDLLVQKVEVRQAAWNVVTAQNDYRVLGPTLVTDPNQNRTAVEHDELGMVVKTAVMGKAGSADGDTLADPTTRIEYELFNWLNNGAPNYVHTFAREQHGAANPRWQESYAYSNGSGGIALVKAQAHPGKAFAVAADGSRVEVDADPRWIGNGRTIVNNKGSPVKQYEPYFSATHEYESEQVLREIGVTPIVYYDPLGRAVRTVFPNGTFARAEFTPWLQRAFDANDTAAQSQWYADRGSPDPAAEPEPLNDPERRAAWLAAKHANTPGVTHYDSLGRAVYAVADYGGGKTAAARTESDLTGRYFKLFDQLGREVAGGFVGMAGHAVLLESAEKGRRWTFQNVLGALVKTWDEHGRRFRSAYDTLHRPLGSFAQVPGQPEILYSYVVYGDRLANAEQLNLLGAAYQTFDQAGMVRVPGLDFRGRPAVVERVLASEYAADVDWGALATQPDPAAIQAAADPALITGEVFSTSAQYDALSRPTRVTLPDGTVMLPQYNQANFLASLRAQVRGQGGFVEFLKSQDYDARGQRQFARYGNDVLTRYFYEPNTFRLTDLLTYKAGANAQTQALQSLHYAYDPVGNITQVRDDAQQTHYFKNAVVRPESRYEYDAVYQLVRATGREHAALGNDSIRTHGDLDAVPQLPHSNNAGAVRTYSEEYEYDLLGNIALLRHTWNGSGWTRRYRYAYQDAPADRTNRLASTSMPGDAAAGPYSATYSYDAFGNMTSMPHLAALDWNWSDQLRRVELGGGGTAYYVYGMGGARTRKVIERNGDQKLEWIFLGPVTIFRRRRRATNALRFERWTVQISDNTGAIAQADTKTRDDDNTDPANPLNVALIRYQYANHLGSAALETDDQGAPISYEEYHPYGTTAYRSSKPGFDLSLKRYRFSGKERDDETGLYYFGARYYAAWLGRWTSADPIGLSKGYNLYKYCSNNPVMLHDPDGMQTREIGGSRVLSDPTQEAAARAELERTQHIRITRMHFGQLPSGRQGWIADEYTPVGSEDDQPDATADEQQEAPSTSPADTTAPGGGDRPSTGSDSTAPPSAPAPEAEHSSGGPAAAPAEDSNAEEARLGSVIASYLGAEGRVAQAVRAVDNARKALIGRNVTTILQHLPEAQRNLDNYQRIARAAFDARNASRAASQARLLPLARLYSRLIDRSGTAARTFGALLNKRIAAAGGDLAQGYQRLATGAGAGRASATATARGASIVGRGLAGVGIALSAYALYEDIRTENYGVTISDAAGIVSGAAVLAGSAPVAAIATGVMATNLAGDWVESAVTPEYGRTAGVAAGTATGAAAGAAIGAAIGVVFFGVGAAPGALIGAAVGGVAGFIGAYW